MCNLAEPLGRNCSAGSEIYTLLVRHRSYFPRNTERFSIEAAWENKPVDVHWQHSFMLLHSIRKIPCGELKTDCVVCFLFPSKHFNFFIQCLIFNFPVDKKFALKNMIMYNFSSPSQCCQLQKWVVSDIFRDQIFVFVCRRMESTFLIQLLWWVRGSKIAG